MFESDVTEAECLSDILEGGNDVFSFYNSTKNVSKYKVNKLAKVGDTCVCPYCAKTFVKRSYQQVFCAPIKTRRGKRYICKDKYWNTDSSRVDRTLQYIW